MSKFLANLRMENVGKSGRFPNFWNTNSSIPTYFIYKITSNKTLLAKLFPTCVSQLITHLITLSYPMNLLSNKTKTYMHIFCYKSSMNMFYVFLMYYTNIFSHQMQRSIFKSKANHNPTSSEYCKQALLNTTVT